MPALVRRTLIISSLTKKARSARLRSKPLRLKLARAIAGEKGREREHATFSSHPHNPTNVACSLACNQAPVCRQVLRSCRHQSRESCFSLASPTRD